MENLKYKYILVFITIIFFTIVNAVAQVGIGIASPNSSAMLDVSSTDKGFLPPRMDETNRNNIGLPGTPATGLVIYNTTTNKLNYYNGTAWQVLETGAGSYVDLTTNQTIAGMKTFTGTIIPQGRLMLPMAELSYFNESAVSVPISLYGDTGYNTGLDGMTKVNPSGANMLNDGFDSNYGNSTYAAPTVVATDSRLTYRGTTTRLFHIALSFSFTPGGNGDIIVFAVARNGIVQDKSKVIIKGGNNTDNQSSAMHVALWLKTSDYIEFYMGKTASAGNITVKSFNFFAMGM
jgi:hypothetical protein